VFRRPFYFPQWWLRLRIVAFYLKSLERLQ
jgi:hypothetical protein